MARGWESKAVEDQMADAREAKTLRLGPRLTPAERDRRSRQAGLLLSRARMIQDLESARDARYRALLERTLAHIDTQLRDTD